VEGFDLLADQNFKLLQIYEDVAAEETLALAFVTSY
jgi:hypothetical protein